MQITIKLLITLIITVLSINIGLGQKNISQIQNQLKKSLQSKNNTKSVELYYELGTSYLKIPEKDKAIEAIEQGIALSKELKNSKLEQRGHYTLGIAYYSLGNCNSAIRSFDDCMENSEETQNDYLYVKAKIMTGKCYASRSKNRKAIKEFEESLPISIEKKYDELVKTCYAELAQLYNSIGDKNKAATYQNNLALLEHESENNTKLSEIESEISEFEKQISTVKSELSEKNETLQKVNDSLHITQALNAQKELEINLLNVENELSSAYLKTKEAEIKNSKIMRNFLIFGIATILLIVGIILYDYRKNMRKNQMIETQHKNIKSSINYAQRIQHAMLPHDDLINQYINNSFILFKPRDVVSGDFYWLKPLESNDQSFAVAAVDCTGHGVPGAFMSMVGMNALNTIVGRGINSASDILSQLHKEIHTSLKQHDSGNKDGMDMALCTVHPHKKKLYFAGAKNSLLYIKNGEIFQLKGDKHPIGGGKNDEVSFAVHEIDLEGEMTFYMNSDGYVDQFGGPKNMKFMSKKFRELLLRITHLPLQKQKERLDDEFLKWKGLKNQIDDVLVMGFKITA